MRISKIKGKPVPPPHPGEKRMWQRCKKCGWTGYRDYIPYSLSGAITVMGCGHDMIDRSCAERISEAKAVSSINAYLNKS